MSNSKTSLTPQQGYDYAAEIDKILNKCMQKYDIEAPVNEMGYAALLRTVASGLLIMREASGCHIPQIARRFPL